MLIIFRKSPQYSQVTFIPRFRYLPFLNPSLHSAPRLALVLAIFKLAIKNIALKKSRETAGKLICG
jgi:hypothetical protein